MTPTILVVGATGNTGRGVVELLSQELANGKKFADHRILAVTRSASSSVAQKFAKLPKVEVAEISWPEITPAWLREQGVVRAFIASHNLPNHFAEESTFLVAALQAGVQYVVRISTTAANVRPDLDVYYPRTHWALEALLSSPEFAKLQWTSLQPNGFTTMVLGPAVELIKKYRADGTQDVLRTMLAEDAPTGVIDPYDVSTVAAQLLLQEDPSPHNKAKYVLNGPEDFSGRQLVQLVEEKIGTKVQNVSFKNLDFIDDMAAASKESPNVILSIKRAPATGWDGLTSVSTTSKEVYQLAAPTRTPAQVLDTLLQE